MKVRSIFIRARKGKYVVTLEYEDSTGRHTKNLSTHTSKSEANKAVVLAKAQYLTGELKMSEKTLVDWCLEYIGQHMQSYTENTVRAYRSAYRVDIAPYFGDMKLKELTAMDLQLFYKYLNDRYSINTALARWRCLKLIVHRAYQLELISKDIVQHVIINKATSRKEKEYYTIEEIHQMLELLKVQGSHLLLPVALASLAGLRIGEIMALTWDDVNLEEKTIDVNKQALTRAGKVTHIPPKYNSAGVICVSSELCNLLQCHKRNAIYNEVCLNSLGRPYRWQNLGHSFSTWCNRNNIRALGMHSLRHTFLTNLANNNVPVHIIRAFARHKSLNVTNNYLHATVQDMVQYVQLLSQ